MADILIDLVHGGKVVRTVRFKDNPGSTAVDQAREFADHHKKIEGRSVRARKAK